MRSHESDSVRARTREVRPTPFILSLQPFADRSIVSARHALKYPNGLRIDTLGATLVEPGELYAKIPDKMAHSNCSIRVPGYAGARLWAD
jgi:hypothetical protein